MLDFCPPLLSENSFSQNLTNISVRLINPDESYINYHSLVFCNSTLSPTGLIFAIIWLLTLFITMATTADEFFCPSLEIIAKGLRCSQNVAGVTLLAFGNGAPEIFASLAGTTKQRSELVISYLLGSGIFLTCIVAGSVVMVSPFKMVELPFFRDVIFYLLAAFSIFLVLWKKVVTLYYAIGFIFLYAIYLTIVLAAHQIRRKYLQQNPQVNVVPPLTRTIERSNSSLRSTIILTGHEIAPWGAPPFIRSSWSTSEDIEHKASGEFKPTVITEESFERTISLPTVVECENCYDESKPLITPRTKFGHWCHYIFTTLMVELSPINFTNWSERTKCGKCFQTVKIPINFVLKLTIPVVVRWCQPLNAIHCVVSPLFFIFAIRRGNVLIHDSIPAWSLVLGIGFIMMIVVFLTSSPFRPPKYRMVFAMMGFVCSITWVYLLANEIVGLLITLGSVFKISDSTLGLTILVWGNSINDVIADVTIAREGYPEMAFSACFGGPMFNQLIGLGLSFTTATLHTRNYSIDITFEQTTKILIGFLFASLIFSLIIVPCVKFQLKRWYGICLHILYLSFLCIIIVNECGILS